MDPTGSPTGIEGGGIDWIADYRCETGEGPRWHPLERRIYWLDIPPGRIFRYEPSTGRHEQVFEAGEAIGGITVQEDGALLLFGARGRVSRWREGNLETLIEEIPEEREGRFNDVIADPEGRVFCGTMPVGERPGRLYRLERDGTLATVLEDAGLSNGMGFGPDPTVFYHTDTAKGTISRFRYDAESGALSEGQVVVRVEPEAGAPDGLAIDAGGDLWSARWGGGGVVRYAADGSEKERVAFPAKKVSSIAFAGDDSETAYVTTAGGGDKATEGAGAGALFRVRLGVGGGPAFLSRVGL